MTAVATKLSAPPIARSRRAAVPALRPRVARGPRPVRQTRNDDADRSARTDARKSRVPRKSSEGTYLSMYFSDMAQLDVLPPEAEFGAAREIETLEVTLWRELLSLPAMLPQLASALAEHPTVATLATDLRELARLSPSKQTAAITRLAPVLRERDEDRVLAEAAMLVVARLALQVGVRGAVAPTLVRAPAFAIYRRKVEAADRAAHAARNAFVKANLRLVVSIARRFNHGRMALADLIQEGNLGLIKAVERYDYKKGFRFSTYASWWIRHAISRALADKGREIRLPVHMIDAQHRLTKARRQLTGELGRDPTVEELAATLQMPADKVEKMRTWVLEQAVPLDGPTGDGDGRILAEVLEDPERNPSTTADDLASEATLREVTHLLGELRPIEAEILRQRFGLTTEQELTLKEIGDKYNLSRERIRQLQEQALAKMRRALARRDML